MFECELVKTNFKFFFGRENRLAGSFFFLSLTDISKKWQPMRRLERMVKNSKGGSW